MAATADPTVCFMIPVHETQKRTSCTGIMEIPTAGRILVTRLGLV
jgi:hypothetical protein